MNLLRQMAACIGAAELPAIEPLLARISLDGVDETVNCGAFADGGEFALRTRPITIIISIRMPSVSGLQSILGNIGTVTAARLFVINGVLNAGVAQAVGTAREVRVRSVASTLSVNTEYLVGLTFDGLSAPFNYSVGSQGVPKVWINGVNVTDAVSGSNAAADKTADMHIGATPFGVSAIDARFLGVVYSDGGTNLSAMTAAYTAFVAGDVDAWTTALESIGTVVRNAPFLTTDSAAPGGSIADLSPESFDLEPVNTEGEDLTELPVVSGNLNWNATNSILLDGNGEYIDCGNNYNQDGSTPMTISAWVRPSNAQTNRGILCKVAGGSGSIPGWQFQLKRGSSSFAPRFYVQDGSKQIVVSTISNAVSLNVWTHLVCTWDGVNPSGVKIFVNGVSMPLSIGGQAITGSPTNNESLRIGSHGSSIRFIGNLRDISLWMGTELSTEEAVALYGGGSDLVNVSGYIPEPSSTWQCGATGDDATGGTGIIQDLVGNIDGIPVNTEAGDIVAQVPS